MLFQLKINERIQWLKTSFWNNKKKLSHVRKVAFESFLAISWEHLKRFCAISRKTLKNINSMSKFCRNTSKQKNNHLKSRT